MGDYLDIDVPDGRFRAHLARPAGSPRAAVVVLREIFGVNQDMRDTCAWLASQARSGGSLRNPKGCSGISTAAVLRRMPPGRAKAVALPCAKRIAAGMRARKRRRPGERGAGHWGRSTRSGQKPERRRLRSISIPGMHFRRLRRRAGA